MTDSHTFSVAGVPIPQGSKTAFIVWVDGKPQARLTEGGSFTATTRHKQWRGAVAQQARDARRDAAPFGGPVEVTIEFLMPRPAAAKDRVRHTVRPDLDKLVRTILDALTEAGVLVDDCQVCSVLATKRYETGTGPGCRVKVVDVSERERGDRDARRGQPALT